MCSAFALLSGEGNPAATKPVILLTGFEPFGGSSFNTSWDLVSPLDGQEIDGYVIRTVKLKVVYDEIGGPLTAAIERLKPAAVISFGEGTKTVQVERVARNGYHPQKPLDNLGKTPPREKIVPGAADEIPTGLPVDPILEKLHAAGIPAAASTDAGGYLCNECFYRLMLVKGTPTVRGFVHVPVVPPKDFERRKPLLMAIPIIVKTVIANLK